MRLFQDKKGATAIEYGLLAALLSVGIVGATQATGKSVVDTFCAVGKKMPGGAGLTCSGEAATPAAWDPSSHYGMTQAEYESIPADTMRRYLAGVARGQDLLWYQTTQPGGVVEPIDYVPRNGYNPDPRIRVWDY